MTADDQSITVTSASSTHDVEQILYGLHLRGIRAQVVESRSKGGDRYDIVLDPKHAALAQEVIERIWDAILEEYPRAMTLEGLCAFCNYDVRALPKPTTCPECGTNLDSYQARRALRDRKTP